LWPVVAATLAVSILIGWRHFFWQHALMDGIGIGALVYVAIQTVERLRNLHK
jgi:hypothetical protein